MKRDSHITRKSLVYSQFPKYDINDDKSVVNLINEIIRIYPFNYKRMIYAGYLEDVKEWVFQKTSNIPENTDFKTRIYMALNDIKEFPRCKICGKEFTEIQTMTIGFQKYCGVKCSMKDDDVKNKIYNTNLLTYGDEHPTKLTEIKNKVVNTLQKRYGVSNPMDISGSVEKIKKTKLERYGDENYNNCEKNKKTCLERYGVEYSTQTDIMKEHLKNTCMERYGVQNAGWTEETQKKIKESNLNRFGVEYSMQNEEVKEKARKTFNEKYGVDTPFQLDWVGELNAIRAKTSSYNNYILNNSFDTPCFTLDDYINRKDEETEFQFKCKKCGETFYSKHVNGLHSKCPTCYPVKAGTSMGENEIYRYITDILNVKACRHNRRIISPYEIDIYIPVSKVGFEYDGMYWHSIMEKPYSYHKTKNDMANKVGVKLYHIFEHYWNTRMESTKSFIKRKLIGCEKLHGNFRIVELDYKTARKFVEENSLYNFNSSINIAMEMNGEIITLMGCSPSTSANKNKCDYVLNYFCYGNNFYFSDTEEKLLSYFVNKYKPLKIQSYADRRYDDGKILDELGFKFIELKNPTLWFFKPNITALYSRSKFRKETINETVEIYDGKQSDVENMLQNGWNAIEDSGYEKYLFEVR